MLNHPDQAAATTNNATRLPIYPMQALAAALRGAGWRGGLTSQGWLFMAHCASERGFALAGEIGSAVAAADDLERRLGLKPSGDLETAGRLIAANLAQNGCLPRKDLRVLEATIARLVKMDH